MRIVQADSPLMEGLSKITNLVILNLAVLVCCLPVITAGAAITGMHYVLLKMVRDEEGYILRSYFKSFKENFLQATGMWLIFLVAAIAFRLDLRLTGSGAEASLQLPAVFRCLLIAAGVYVFAIYLYAFPLLARFQNTVFGTLRNAAVFAVAWLPRTIGMAAAAIVLPAAFLLIRPILPLLVLVGMTGPGYICALLYSPAFKKLEANVEYRFPIFGDLYGAIFLDAGNVWLMREDPSRPGGHLTLKNFAKSIALNTGAGIRYDLEFLVIRLDLGVALHMPYDTGKSGYYNIPKFKDGLGLHFAIGYPF